MCLGRVGSSHTAWPMLVIKPIILEACGGIGTRGSKTCTVPALEAVPEEQKES